MKMGKLASLGHCIAKRDECALEYYLITLSQRVSTLEANTEYGRQWYGNWYKSIMKKQGWWYHREGRGKGWKYGLTIYGVKRVEVTRSIRQQCLVDIEQREIHNQGLREGVQWQFWVQKKRGKRVNLRSFCLFGAVSSVRNMSELGVKDRKNELNKRPTDSWSTNRYETDRPRLQTTDKTKEIIKEEVKDR